MIAVNVTTAEGSRNSHPDCKHANIAGCYLAGLVWYEALTGNDVREIK